MRSWFVAFGLLAALSSYPAFAARLAPPSQVEATPYSSSEIRLTWQDNSATESGFHIYAALDKNGVPGSYQLVGTAGQNATNFVCTGLAMGTRYWFAVESFSVSAIAPSNSPVAATTTTATQIKVYGYPSAAATGNVAQVQIALLDQKGKLVKNFPHAIHLSSSDPLAPLPDPFESIDEGRKSVYFAFESPGTQWIAVSGGTLIGCSVRHRSSTRIMVSEEFAP